MRIILKKLLRILLCISLLTMSSCGLQQNVIRFGAASPGGMYYSFGTLLTQLASQDMDGNSFEVKATAGSAANLRLLSDHYIELGIAQADLIHDAYYGTGDFKNDRLSGYKAIASLYAEACQLVVRADSSIQTLDDLQGKTVCIGEEDSGTERNAKQILEMSGLTDQIIDTVNLDYTNMAKQLESGKIDAFFITAGIQTTVIEELTRRCDIRLISLDQKCINKIQSAYEFYTEYTIPANTYTGQTEDVHTISVRSVLLADTSLSDKTVERLTKALFDHAQEIQYATSVDFLLTEADAVEGAFIPFHSGAAAYYAGKNIQVKTD